MYHMSHQLDEFSTRLFLRSVLVQGRGPDLPDSSKNASDPIGIPLKRGASVNKPSSSKES